MFSRKTEVIIIKRYFGTDGIRGTADGLLTADVAFRTGQALGIYLDGAGKKVLVAKDSRMSGDMLEHAVSAGLMAAGVDVIAVGIISTPGAAYLTARLGCAAGVVISASHNPPEYNGIKILDSRGIKYNDAEEESVERLINYIEPVARAKTGRRYTDENAWRMYADRLVEIAGCDLKSMRFVVDCAYGAACQAAEYVFGKLHCKVYKVACSPTGRLINSGCGATHPEKAAMIAKKHGVAAFCFDGDADRIIAADEDGNLVDGDYLLYLNAMSEFRSGRLRGNVIATVMSNSGFEIELKKHGIGMTRVSVGDKYVAAEMERSGSNIGGEQSGHIIFSDYATTGDGLLTAVLTAKLTAAADSPLSALTRGVVLIPQKQRSIKVADKRILTDLRFTALVEEERARLTTAGGRLIVRPSGTEPKIRIMAECPDAQMVDSAIEKISALITG